MSAPATPEPKWATRRWRLLYRLLRAVPADEAEQYAVRLHNWEAEISDALDLTVVDHGVHRADLDRCLAEIRTLRERPVDDPDNGHTFRIVATSRMSSMVVGDDHHRDADDFSGSPWSLDVRAWSLRAALLRAAHTPLSGWQYADGGHDG